MHYDLHTATHLPAHMTCVIGFFADQPLDTTIPFIKEHEAELSAATKTLTTAGQTAWRTDFEHPILLVHCGEAPAYTEKKLMQWLDTLMPLLLTQQSTEVLICMPPLSTRSVDWQLMHMQLRIDYLCYQCLTYKTKDVKPHALKTVNFYLPEAHHTKLETADAIAQGIRFARDLANAPANVCTPTYLAKEALAFAKQHATVTAKHFDREALEKMGLRTLLAVAQGSHESPQFIEVHYQGGPKDAPPVVLVGKGITFDAGGISLKPAAGMSEMKYDMGGAASVLGTLKACALLKLPLNVIGLMACAENLPGGHALKPGDVIKTYAGLTVEITNTDAEGRLVLADALHYAKQFNPQLVIDIATLTGAVIIALGHVHTGVMTKDETLAQWIAAASDASQDTTWRLPLEEAYESGLESGIADMVNSTETRDAGSITAGCFLSRFTEGYRWAHLDVAGTAWISGKKNQATGRPVGLLVALLQQVLHAR